MMSWRRRSLSMLAMRLFMSAPLSLGTVSEYRMAMLVVDSSGVMVLEIESSLLDEKRGRLARTAASRSLAGRMVQIAASCGPLSVDTRYTVTVAESVTEFAMAAVAGLLLVLALGSRLAGKVVNSNTGVVAATLLLCVDGA